MYKFYLFLGEEGEKEENIISESDAEEPEVEEEEGEEEEKSESEDEEGPRVSASKSKLKNYYKLIADHKEIVRNVMSLQGALLLLKPDVMKCTEVSFSDFFCYIKMKSW